MRLERLTYRSIATGRTSSLLNLATILAESQQNNAARGLTGALAAHDDRYIQVIEGAPDQLDALLVRLGRDLRHKDIVVLDRAPIESRMFGDWTMASPRIDPGMTATLDRLMAEAEPRPGLIVTLLREALSAGQTQVA